MKPSARSGPPGQHGQARASSARARDVPGPALSRCARVRARAARAPHLRLARGSCRCVPAASTDEQVPADRHAGSSTRTVTHLARASMEALELGRRRLRRAAASADAVSVEHERDRSRPPSRRDPQSGRSVRARDHRRSSSALPHGRRRSSRAPLGRRLSRCSSAPARRDDDAHGQAVDPDRDVPAPREMRPARCATTRSSSPTAERSGCCCVIGSM